MIIFGTRAAQIKSVLSKQAVCPNCNEKGSIIISVFRKHAHIFWIPMFPIGKRGISQCQNCKNVLSTKEMPNSIRNEYSKLKDENKGSLWQFSGLALFAILISWAFYQSGENEKLEQQYLATPKRGDVYEYKIEGGFYSTLKVIEVNNDSLLVVPNDYEIDKMSKLYKIDKDENYSEEFSFKIAKKEIETMYNSGEIFDINR